MLLAPGPCSPGCAPPARALPANCRNLHPGASGPPLRPGSALRPEQQAEGADQRGSQQNPPRKTDGCQYKNTAAPRPEVGPCSVLPCQGRAVTIRGRDRLMTRLLLPNPLLHVPPPLLAFSFKSTNEMFAPKCLSIFCSWEDPNRGDIWAPVYYARVPGPWGCSDHGAPFLTSHHSQMKVTSRSPSEKFLRVKVICTRSQANT